MKEAEHSLQGLTDSLQVFKVAQEMIPELENRRGEQGGDMDGEEMGRDGIQLTSESEDEGDALGNLDGQIA